eukprot:116684-Rhodomonas_salina.2
METLLLGVQQSSLFIAVPLPHQALCNDRSNHRDELQDCLEGGVNCLIFITPPKGWGEQEDVVYECQRQLYSIPDSARALSKTLDAWFNLKSQGFHTAGFEESICTFLTHFEGTNEGDVNTYLGGELIRDSANCTITYRHASVYACKILQIYGEWDKPSVGTQLEAGMLLTKADSPS